MQAIFERTSIRDFSDREVEASKVTRLLEAAMQAPSAGNQQPWEFVVVTDRALLAELSEASQYAKPLKRAPLGVAVLERRENLRFPTDTCSDLGASTENILLEAVYLGLGACWLGIAPIAERMAHVAAVLGLPEQIHPFALIALGYPKAPKQATQRYDASRVHYGRY